MLGDKITLAAAETSHLMALPLEVLELILRYAIANSVVEVREVQDYLDESAVRMIDFPTGDAVNAGGLMPSTASSLLRVNKAISRVLVASFDLPDTLFSRDTKFMFSLMNDIEISRAHIHIHICRIFCRGNSRWIDNWELWKYERQGHLGQSFVFKGEA
jgi:hypothetical protein